MKEPPPLLDASEEDPSDPDFMTSLARGLSVIQAFGDDRAALTISQVSAWTGMSRAAARRCLHTLGKLGFVSEGDSRTFSLRPKVMTLGHAYLSSLPFYKAASPVLKQLTNELNETASLSVLDGDEILYVARSQSKRLMVINLHVGSRLPAVITAPGRVLLCHLDAKSIDDRLARANVERRTPHTTRTPAALRKELERVRGQGYAINDQELEIGLRTIAVPVLDKAGNVGAALSIGTHVARNSVTEMVQRLLPAMQAAATELRMLVA